MSVSLDDETVAAAKEAAAIEGMSLSAWLSAVALLAAKRTIGLQACAEVEAEIGPYTKEEIEKAAAAIHQIKTRPRNPLSEADIDRLLDAAERRGDRG